MSHLILIKNCKLPKELELSGQVKNDFIIFTSLYTLILL